MRAGVVIAALLLLPAGCAPTKISRIGPTVPPRGEGCGIQVLDPGAEPDRPYRDVGMVTLEACQDYRTPPCRGRLTDAACELGGHAAYLPEGGGRPRGPVVDKVDYRVLVAAFVADLRVPIEENPVARSRICDPPCGADELCRDGACQPADDCGEPEHEEIGKCLE